MEFVSANSALSGGLAAARERAAAWLRSGLEPRRLAFTLALGFAIGCLPMLGVTTGICALLAMLFGLNMPAIQAANWVAMPLQAVLLVPFLRMGQWLLPGSSHGAEAGLRGLGGIDLGRMVTHAMAAPMHALEQAASLFGRALLAWGVTALPALVVLTLLLTPVLHLVRRQMAASIEG